VIEQAQIVNSVELDPDYLPGLIDPRQMNYIRVTSLKAFEECPYSWAVKYLTPGEPEEEHRTGAAAIGTAVHAILEDFLMQLHAGTEAGNMLTNWEIVPEHEHQAVHDYMASVADIQAINPIAIEERLFYPIVNGMPPISGQMDFVTEIPGNGLLILDHKTNRKFDGVEFWRIQLQQLLYAWMARKEWPGYSVYKFRIGYPNLGSYVEWETSADDDEPLVEHIENIWTKILKHSFTNIWPRHINQYCGRCPIKFSCPLYTEATNGLVSSLQARLTTATTASKLEQMKAILKVVEAEKELLEAKLKLEIKEAGGRLVSGDNVYSLEFKEQREADFRTVWGAMNGWANAQVETDPNAIATLNEILPMAFGVRVTGLDAIAKQIPSLKQPFANAMQKVPSKNATIVSTPKRKGIDK